jgi:phosphoacetylglucosamine mutase
VMITASHNPPQVPCTKVELMQDNGVKLVDPQGEMLEASWEAYATLFANAVDEDALLDAIRKVVNHTKLDLTSKARVIQGRDTRPSGQSLSQSLSDGLNAFEADHVDYGLLTTPQLHYLVKCLNTEGTNAPYGEPTEEGYYHKLATAFNQLMQGKKAASQITVDCANGVGAPKLAELVKILGNEHLRIKIVNHHIGEPEKLNKEVLPPSHSAYVVWCGLR